MAVENGFGKVVTSGSVFMYDTGDTVNSYKGRPTTNLVGTGMSIYNNVPGSVNATLTETSETYMGAPVWMQTLTPIDANGVSWLSYGNNPGIGVVHSGGGGTANRYTGFSIFFKSTVPMNSVPIFLAYSNIGGWQCNTCPPEDMGGGWYRAKVLWYDTVTRVDGKYWAINPLAATLNVPITIYWAGPFKEDLNSQIISQYTPTSRSATQGLLPLVGNSSIDLSNVSFDSAAQITFDGTDDYFDIATNFSTVSQYTIEYVAYKGAEGKMPIAGRTNASFYKFGDYSWAYTHGGIFDEFYHEQSPAISGYIHCVITYDGSFVRVWRNGYYAGAKASSGTADFSNGFKVGYWSAGGNYAWTGPIPIVKIYNRALSSSEVQQNYNKYKSRFNLS